MQISTAYGSTSPSLGGQLFETALSPSAKPAATHDSKGQEKPAPTSGSKDQVEFSDKALESFQKLGQPSDHKPATTFELLKDLLGLLSGRNVNELQTGAEGAAPGTTQPALADGAPATTQPALAAGYQETTLSTESISLSLSGTNATKDGKQLGFSLNIQYSHASFASETAQVQAGSNGLSLNFAGTAAELSSTSFNFTLSGTRDSGPIGGRGSFQLRDEVNSIGKQLKPLLKEFMEATGVHVGWRDMIHWLRSVV